MRHGQPFPHSALCLSLPPRLQVDSVLAAPIKEPWVPNEEETAMVEAMLAREDAWGCQPCIQACLERGQGRWQRQVGWSMTSGVMRAGQTSWRGTTWLQLAGMQSAGHPPSLEAPQCLLGHAGMSSHDPYMCQLAVKVTSTLRCRCVPAISRCGGNAQAAAGSCQEGSAVPARRLHQPWRTSPSAHSRTWQFMHGKSILSTYCRCPLRCPAVQACTVLQRC